MIINLSLLLILTLLIILFFLISKPERKNRHSHNIKKSHTIIEKISNFKYEGQRINYLRKIDPFVFEELLLSSFEKKGYSIKRNIKYTGDNGFDGVVFDSNNNEILIQAKRYKGYINPKHVESFNCLIKSKKAYKGYFIHTGKTGKLNGNDYLGTIEIISGSKLLNLIK
jgi:restriction system protein